MDAPENAADAAPPAKRFGDLTPQLGARLQIELSGNGVGSRHVVALIGHMPGESVMVRAPVANGVTVPIAEGETAVVRGFCGLSAFAFQTHVIRVCKAPFAYLHLADPDCVQEAPVRKARRVKVGLPVTLGRPGEDGIEGKILDLSSTGAQIETSQACGDVGSTVKLAFKLPTDEGEVPMEVDGEVRNLREPGEEQAGQGCRCGVSFKSLSREHAAILQTFLYRTTFERRCKAA